MGLVQFRAKARPPARGVDRELAQYLRLRREDPQFHRIVQEIIVEALARAPARRTMMMTDSPARS